LGKLGLDRRHDSARSVWRLSIPSRGEYTVVRFGVRSPSWVYGPVPTKAFDGINDKSAMSREPWLCLVLGDGPRDSDRGVGAPTDDRGLRQADDPARGRPHRRCLQFRGRFGDREAKLAVLRSDCDAAHRDYGAIARTHDFSWLVARDDTAAAAKRERLRAWPIARVPFRSPPSDAVAASCDAPSASYPASPDPSDTVWPSV
jgi:hypothetical protein